MSLFFVVFPCPRWFTHVFSRNGSGFVLDAIDLRIEPGKLLGVVGPVGSSKSSLLMAVLREISPENADGMRMAVIPDVSGEVGACRGWMRFVKRHEVGHTCRSFYFELVFCMANEGYFSSPSVGSVWDCGPLQTTASFRWKPFFRCLDRTTHNVQLAKCGILFPPQQLPVSDGNPSRLP